LEPVFEELERRKALVYVHPNPSPDPAAHSLVGLPDNLIDFPTDTNRAVAQMHYTNRFARTPDVKYIFSHAGGSIPYLAARFAIIDEIGFIPGGKQRGSAAEMFRAFIGIRLLLQASLCSACCITERESHELLEDRVFRLGLLKDGNV
jgi:6-methylsalicylate decarboxylase